MPRVEIINVNAIDDFKMGQAEVNQNNCSLIQFGPIYKNSNQTGKPPLGLKLTRYRAIKVTLGLIRGAAVFLPEA